MPDLNLGFPGQWVYSICLPNCDLIDFNHSGPAKVAKVVFQFPTCFNLSLVSYYTKSLQMVTAAMKLKDAYSLEAKLWPT